MVKTSAEKCLLETTGGYLRLIRAFTVCLFLAGPPFALFHLATAQHLVCPDHGEFIHLPVQGSGSATLYFSVLPNDRDAAHSDSGPWGSTTFRLHDVCEVCATSRERIGILAEPHSNTEVPREGLTDLVPEAAWQPQGETLYLLAPKHSPPV